MDQLKSSCKSLEIDLQHLREQYNQETDEEKEIQWSQMIEAKEKQLEHIKNDLFKQQQEIKNQFMNNIFRKRSLNMDEFNIAKKDAEDTAFKIITASPNDIAQFFSTRTKNIVAEGIVRPNKFIHSWFYPIKTQNIIPLSPGISPPQTRQKDGTYRETEFKMDRILIDKQFIQRCKEYYDSFGIDLTISKDKEYNRRKRFWITLKIKNGYLNFNEKKI
jgi:hypothetical protein